VSRWESWCFGALTAVVAATGVAYLWMRYLVRNDDPFAVVNHPWQPAALAGHVLAAPLLVLMFGVVFRSHVLAKLATGRRGRRSGWLSLASFALMASSGYLLQVLTEPAWLRVATALHLASSGVFLLGYAAHLVAAWRSPAPAAGSSRAALAAANPSLRS